MQVKVCGITQLQQFFSLADAGADYAGFIFYPPSPRHVGKADFSPEEIKKAGLNLYKVGVFVDAPYDEVMQQIEAYGLDMVQLHGHETPYECSRIAAHIDVIKAFRFSENDHVFWTIKDFYADTDFFLFDTGVPAPKTDALNHKIYGGTGRKFNWNRLKGLNIQKPFFLSGGIEPGDVGTIKEFMKDEVAKDLTTVDINSRFESAPGVKDMKLVTEFITQLKMF